jgi:hypothetical protein
MKRKREYIYIVIGAALLCGLIYTLVDNPNPKVSNVRLRRHANDYRVAFQIENRLNYVIEADIVMLATMRRFVGDGEVFDQVGSETMTLKLAPREKKRVEHDVAAKDRGIVTFVTVHAAARR